MPCAAISTGESRGERVRPHRSQVLLNKVAGLFSLPRAWSCPTRPFGKNPTHRALFAFPGDARGNGVPKLGGRCDAIEMLDKIRRRNHARR